MSATEHPIFYIFLVVLLLVYWKNQVRCTLVARGYLGLFSFFFSSRRTGRPCLLAYLLRQSRERASQSCQSDVNSATCKYRLHGRKFTCLTWKKIKFTCNWPTKGRPSVDQVRPSFESLLVSSALTAEGGKAFDHRLAGFLSPLSLDGQKVEYRTATSSRKMAIPT